MHSRTSLDLNSQVLNSALTFSLSLFLLSNSLSLTQRLRRQSAGASPTPLSTGRTTPTGARENGKLVVLGALVQPAGRCPAPVQPFGAQRYSPILSIAKPSRSPVPSPTVLSSQMMDRWCILLFMVLSCTVKVSHGSVGDADPTYRSCVKECMMNGCVGERCFLHCNSSSDVILGNGQWYMQEPLYLRWKQWDCQGDCRYYCMVERERVRRALGNDPVKYHGKWPFKRIFGLQEAASVALSILNLAMHFHGWLSFSILVYYKLPLKQNRTCYEYTTLWHIYALLSLNSWFWSAVFHSRDVDLTEKLDYTSAVAVLGYSLIVSIMRSFNVRDEAARVMVAAPLLAFIATHILYLINFKMDYGWNMQVCVAMGVAQLLIWAIWAGITRHPSRWKLWFVVVAGGLAMLLEIYDFPPYQELVDAHALWHATTIPLTYLWWSFIRDDAQYRTSQLMKKVK